MSPRPATQQHPAAGDCERIRPGPIGQPVNAASSLAYLGAAAWLWRRARHAGPPPPETAVFCALLAANAVGGVAFHGPGDRASHWLHDTALVGTLGAMAVERAGLAAGLAGLAGAGLAVRPDATNAASMVGTMLVAGNEARRRRGRRPAAGSRARRPAATSGVLLLAAAGVNVLSRSGGPWCRPDSVLQGHALWHVLTAASLAAWGAGARVRPT